MTERIRSFVMTLWQDEGDETPEEAPDLVMLMSRSLDCMQTQITRLRLATHSIDAVVEIPRNLCGFFEFYRARELIAYGYDEAGRQLADLAGSSRPAQLPGR